MGKKFKKIRRCWKKIIFIKKLTTKKVRFLDSYGKKIKKRKIKSLWQKKNQKGK